MEWSAACSIPTQCMMRRRPDPADLRCRQGPPTPWTRDAALPGTPLKCSLLVKVRCSLFLQSQQHSEQPTPSRCTHLFPDGWVRYLGWSQNSTEEENKDHSSSLHQHQERPSQPRQQKVLRLLSAPRVYRRHRVGNDIYGIA